MNRAFPAALTALLATAGLPAGAQAPAPDAAGLRGDSAQTRKRLAEAEQKLLKGKAADAADDLQRVLDEAAEDFVTADGRQYRPARWVAHQLLARFPADALKGYQDRVDDPARKLLDAAKRTREPAPLWLLLDRYFVSRPADEGLLLLGELLFERGEFRTAEMMWRRLLPDGGADVTYPGSKADPAAVRARIVLAAVFQGDAGRAREELAALRAKHPGAAGPLAGVHGPYEDALQPFLDAPPRLAPAANPGSGWPTPGGGPDRSGRVGVRLPADLPARPTWVRDLPAAAPANPATRPPFGHPVIADGRVFVTDGSRVFGYDLLTGRPTALVAPNRPAAGERATPDACPTLTAAGNLLYARLGPPAVRAPNPADAAGTDETTIVCLGPAGKPGGDTGVKELWRVRPPADDGKGAAVWEGAPVVSGRRMWAAYARFEGGRVVQGVACFDPADPPTAPDRPAWVADVTDGPLPLGGDGRARPELLTLAGRTVVFNTNAGAVAALDAATGRRVWGFRYPRAKRADGSRSPDPAPAVACGGRVFVAPADADRVYALDAETGQLLWESGPTEGAHVLGVADGRVVVSVAGPVRGLRALGVGTGSHRDGEGWVLHDGGGLSGYGRGFVTDDAIVWPTRNGLYAVRPRDGSPVRAWDAAPTGGPRANSFGNVVYADGVLVVVTPTQIWGYVSGRARFGEPQSARGRFDRLIDRAEGALAAGRPAAARSLLLDAARGEFPAECRAWAAARVLLLTPNAANEAGLPADLRAVFTADLRGEWLLPPDGVPITLDTLVGRHTGRSRAASPPPAVAGGRDPADAPTLAPGAGVARTLTLPRGAAPLRPLPGAADPPARLFVSAPDHLLAVPLAGGEPVRFDAADFVTHAADLSDEFVAAGPSAVAVYGIGPAPEWVFRVPATPPLPAAAGDALGFPEDAPGHELSSFRLAGAWLVARLGDRHLIALDLKARRVAWVLGAGGEPGFRPVAFPDAPRFGPEFAVAGRSVVAQGSGGRRWFVAADTGKVLDVPGFGTATARVWWVLPPAEVEPNRLAVSDGPGLVRVLNLAAGRVKWTRVEDGETGLSGEPPQVRAWAGAVLIAVRRNHGIDLTRLDPEGKAAWHAPAFLDADRVSLAAADADADRVYVPSGNTLAAFDLADGRPAWAIALPDARGAGGWVVRAGRKCVIAYPAAAIPREPVAGVLDRLARSFRTAPLAWRLPGLAGTAYDAWVNRSVPVLLFDPATGKPLGRIEIPAAGPAVTAWFRRDTVVVATGDRVCWLK